MKKLTGIILVIALLLSVECMMVQAEDSGESGGGDGTSWNVVR